MSGVVYERERKKSICLLFIKMDKGGFNQHSPIVDLIRNVHNVLRCDAHNVVEKYRDFWRCVSSWLRQLASFRSPSWRLLASLEHLFLCLIWRHLASIWRLLASIWRLLALIQRLWSSATTLNITLYYFRRNHTYVVVKTISASHAKIAAHIFTYSLLPRYSFVSPTTYHFSHTCMSI